MFEIDIYLDIKSPHSYLMMKPAIQLMRDYECKVNFKPYNLSYVDINVTTKYDETNPARIPKDAVQDRRARMYYTVARVYAKGMGLRIRGPEILLNSDKANIGTAWALQHACSEKYLSILYELGWPNGWRDCDMNDISTLKTCLAGAGMKKEKVDLFDEYLNTRGKKAVLDHMKIADNTGFVGVPHIVFDLNNKSTGMFGREHLSLVRHTMHERGLARSNEVSWQISHYWNDDKII